MRVDQEQKYKICSASEWQDGSRFSLGVLSIPVA
jgi:hypothetical protein